MKIAGVDEVGVGCLAGPVISAAVVFGNNKPDLVFKDSKKTSESKRAQQAKYINQNFYVGIGIATPKEIDALNVLKATHLAMKRAVHNLPVKPAKILIDGVHVPENLDNAEAIVKGDEQYQEIAAASIVAKHFRDQLMIKLSEKFNNYAWESNFGYGTKAHLEGLKKFGITSHHRKGFKPVHKILSN